MMQTLPLTASHCRAHCATIARWWADHAIDPAGGFYGQINDDGSVEVNANKGIILNTRILWFFSEAAVFLDSAECKALASRAYHYLLDHFDDKVQGGVFWELDAQGQLVNGKKQTYAQSFAIYALCAYYKATGEQAALDKALSYFQLLDQHSWDPQQLGYLEAFSQSWQALQDLRLSDKDLNYPKTMNTHLHVLEAYTALYLQHKTAEVQQALERLTLLFAERIVNASNGHLRLFMDLDWADHSPFYSYGHDIEASWLLWEALRALNDPHLQQLYRPLVLQMADVALQQGLCADGHLADEWHLATQQQHQQSCWWIQAEALVGFLTAWRLTGDMGYFSAAEGLWAYIQREHIDAVGGEWHWLAASHPDRATQYKVGFWKGPYHSGRAMMEAALLLEQAH